MRIIRVDKNLSLIADVISSIEIVTDYWGQSYGSPHVLVSFVLGEPRVIFPDFGLVHDYMKMYSLTQEQAYERVARETKARIEIQLEALT